MTPDHETPDPSTTLIAAPAPHAPTQRGARVYRLLQAVARQVQDLRVALGLLLIGGGLVTVVAAWALAELTEAVLGGQTQRFDERVLQWIAGHHGTLLDYLALQITSLGDIVVVFVIAGIVALFLTLLRHRYSAALVVGATLGAVAISTLLKLVVERPRPHVFEWGTQVVTSSFPSGHATAAVAAYGTIAFVAARLHRHAWARRLTLLIATVLIAAIAASRLWLGVHYPSDVVGGALLGLAWAAFCAAVLAAIQRFIVRDAPAEAHQEEPPPAADDARGAGSGRRRLRRVRRQV